MVSWSFLSSHARVLLCIARDPAVRLRDIAASVGLTERSAHTIVSDLAGAGYVVRQKDGRRNRYQIHAYLPLPEAGTGGLAIGDILALLAGARPASPASPAEGPLTPGAGRQLRPRSFAGTRDKPKSDPPARSIIQRP